MAVNFKNRWVAAAVVSCLVGIGVEAVRARRPHGPNGTVEAGMLQRASIQQGPAVFLWAWERPEDLRFLASQKNVGVAFLAGTVELRQLTAPRHGDGVIFHPRHQPLRVDAATPLMAVVRIESSHDPWHRPSDLASATESTWYTDEQRKRVADLIVSTAKLPRVGAVQIDFDASESEQPFYAALLKDVRRQLPQNMPLSITALASWCIGDPWLNRLPAGTIDEAVPMLFRMGLDAESVATFVSTGREFGPRVCRDSLGVSTDETFSRSLLNGTTARGSSKRVYVFSDASWTDREATKVIEEVER
ncbi:MAG TPA: DUF3142 domain-containing protein [Candidatus Acidoferrales bacterium]